MGHTCTNCRAHIEEWNKSCGSCGFRLVLVPEAEARERYLRVPSLGALLWTQGWAFGARLYLWFVLSLIPPVGPFVLVLCVIFGRRWSWKHGSWTDWEEFRSRMRLLDILAGVWAACLLGAYLYFRFVVQAS